MTRSLAPEVTVLPAEWPGPEHEGPRPGDLDQFSPQGLALAAPMIVRPYGGMADPEYYAASGTITHPIRSAPTNDEAGGVIYFSGDASPESLSCVLGVMAVRVALKGYAVFTTSSREPRRDKYLDQMRVVQKEALSHFFGARGNDLPDQAVDVRAAISRFIAWQSWKWEHDPAGPSLAGTMGGDGDWAKERLAFGFMVENSYWGIYRVWSRAWLVTK